jgi:polyvinyl alcohol dehydrogenase (cytochrome)
MKRATQISLVLTIAAVFFLSGVLGLTVFSSAASASPALQTPVTTQNWTSFTYNYNNTRYNPNSLVTSSNVNTLQMLWHVDQGQVNTGEPIVSNGAVYFGDWGGYAYSINLTTGATIWKDDMSTITSSYLHHTYKAQISGTFLAQGGVIYGGMSPYGPNPVVFALNQKTGALLWEQNLSAPPYSATLTSIWASPIYYNGLIYIGSAAFNESNARQHGVIYALDASNGAMAWKFLTAPNGDPGGAGVWSSVVVNPSMNAIYFGTANSYHAGKAKSTPYSEAIISLNAMTGSMNWAYMAHVPSEGDLDLGATPNLFSVNIGGTVYQAVGDGSKDGYYYVVNAVTGTLLEKIEISVGSGSSGVIGLAGVYYNSPTNPELYIVGQNYKCKPVCADVRAYDPGTNSFTWTHTDSHKEVGSITIIPGAMLYPDEGGYITALSLSTGTVLYSGHFQGSARGGITVVGNMVLFTTSDGCYALILS